jgi:hypothetical protein
VNTIPIYDATAPITCTIGRDEMPEHIELVERMRQNLERLERTEHGLLLHFPDLPEVQADLARFAVDEKRCCQFWGFAVDNTDGDLTPALGRPTRRQRAHRPDWVLLRRPRTAHVDQRPPLKQIP